MTDRNLQNSDLYEEKFHKKAMRSNAVFFAVLIALFFLAVAGRMAFSSVYCGICVEGSSMANTLSSGDYLYADMKGKAERGDIIVIDVSSYRQSGESYSSDYIIKRLIATEGDQVYCQGGQVYIRYAGTDVFLALEEDYVSSATPDFSAVTVGEGEIFFLGDNRANSKDSTEVGCYREEDIFGVVAAWSFRSKQVLTFIYHYFY